MNKTISCAAVMILALVLSFIPHGPASAQDTGPGESGQAERLAKELTNPLADLVSIPFQFNWENGVGENDDLRFVLNMQPVVPFSISEEWNLIGRFILPFISQPPLFPGGATVSGTGDIVVSAFFSPKASRVMWGVGPVFALPTTTDPLLGSGKWSAGPTAVVVRQKGPWTFGGLSNHLWSFADTGDVDRTDVSQTFIQPFLAYTTKQAVTFSVTSESSANWKADSGQKWTVPINAGASKVTRLGPFPFSIQGALGYYVESPNIGPDWKLRMTFTLILPRAKG